MNSTILKFKTARDAIKLQNMKNVNAVPITDKVAPEIGDEFFQIST